MKYFQMILLSILLSSCEDRGQPVSITDAADNFNVEKIFKKDNCTVYRFYDSGNHYFTDCGETMSTVSCGKHCTRQENIK